MASLSLTGTGSTKRTVIGPTGTKEYLNTVLKLSDTYLTFPLEIIELEPEKVHFLGKNDFFIIYYFIFSIFFSKIGNIEGITITAAPLKHKGIFTYYFYYILLIIDLF